MKHNTSLASRPIASRRAARWGALALLGSLTACSAAQATPADPVGLATDGVIVITNSRANVPMPRIPASNADLLREALAQGLPVAVVSADGTPERVALDIPAVSGNNAPARGKSLNTSLQYLAQAVTVLPNADGANGYGAMAVARDLARSYQLTRPTIICLQCGIDTEGALSMIADGALRASADDYAEYLTATGQLVQFGEHFDEAHVVLTSTGDTAPPQQALSPSDKEHLTRLWAAVLEAGGATVTVDPYPAAGDPVETEFTVPTVDVSAVPPLQVAPEPTVAACTPQHISFDGASDARFEPETDHWVDVAAARRALTPLAAWLTADPARTARIFGTTAGTNSGRPDEGKELSLRRAMAAEALLLELGVAEAQITDVEGLGPDYEGRVPDRDAAGNPIPSERTKNRKVIVEIAETC